MNYNFKKLNTKVLSFDPVDDIDKIIFNHYIMRKENKNRITKKLEDGQFKIYGIMTLEVDLVSEYLKSLQDTDAANEEMKNKIRAAADKAYAELDAQTK